MSKIYIQDIKYTFQKTKFALNPIINVCHPKDIFKTNDHNYSAHSITHMYTI